MAGHDTSTGVTAKQKRKLEAQVDLRLASRADTVGSSKRRTGKRQKDIRGGVAWMPDKLAGTETSLTDAMKQHVRQYRTSKPVTDKYSADIKRAFAGAETDHEKSQYFQGGGPIAGHTRRAYGVGASGQKRKDVRAWGENIVSAYKKKYDIGSGSTAKQRSDYTAKLGRVAARRRHLIGPKAKPATT